LQEEIDACTHIKAQRYESKDYRAFSAAEEAKHWQLMHPTKIPRGVERGRGGGRRTAEDLRRDYETERKASPSTISDTSTKRAKYEDTTDNGSDLFPADDESTTSTNRKNKALTRSSPFGCLKKSDE
jgi:hypothetical protein